MSRILVHVEGETEEDFVKYVLAKYLGAKGYDVGARLLGNARQRNRRGGIRDWELVRKDILRHLKNDQGAIATTIVDYYGLPENWPGRAHNIQNASPRVCAESVQQAIGEDIAGELGYPKRFIPYVVMHEFEGLLFSDPGKLADSIGKPELTAPLSNIREEFESPEHINDSEHTAPSKRITGIYEGYQKRIDGVQAIQQIGLAKIREECPLFNDWIEKLECMPTR